MNSYNINWNGDEPKEPLWKEILRGIIYTPFAICFLIGFMNIINNI